MKKIIISLVVIFNSLFLIQHSIAQWSADMRLTNNPASSLTSYNNARCIAANGSDIHIVWYDYRDGNWQIYYKRSNNGGTSWGSDIRLVNSSSNSDYPSIAISGSFIYVVWRDYRDNNFEIYYKRSSDGGSSWGSDIRLTNNSAGSHQPSIAVSGSLICVVWNDNRNGDDEIYFKCSNDGGLNWGTDTRLTNSTGLSEYPSIAVSGSTINVVWQDNRDGNSEIYYKRSNDGGGSWGSDIRMTNNSAESEHPSIALSGTVYYVVWMEYRDGNWEIYYKRSSDSGLNWGTDTRLTNNNRVSEYPSIATSGSLVHLVWEDDRDLNREIYYKRSTNGGLNWSSDTRLTNSYGESEYPSIAVSGSAVNVVWQDNRDGNYEIYYKNDPTGNNIGIQVISSEIPQQYNLWQNYPNPFNPVTNIEFDIPKSSYVTLGVYDIIGREMAMLINENLSPGSYRVNFDGSNLTSGVYYYRLTTGDYTKTNKMILVK